MAKTYRDQVLVLKKIDFAEADAILTLFGRHQGITSAIAKGVRRMKSRKSGNLELFNQIEVLMAEGRNLDIVSEASVVDSFDHWREDIEAISLAYYATDITSLLLAEADPQPYIYDRLVELYAWLGRVNSLHLLVRWYEVQLLNHLGFWSSQTLESQSLNAISLLDSFATMDVRSLAQLKGSEALTHELERLMRWQMAMVLDKQPKSEGFVDQVRDLSS